MQYKNIGLINATLNQIANLSKWSNLLEIVYIFLLLDWGL